MTDFARMKWLAVPIVVLALSGCGGSSATQKADDDLAVATSRVDLFQTIADQNGQELEATARYIERVRSVHWSSDEKQQELDDSASSLISTCFSCYQLVEEAR